MKCENEGRGELRSRRAVIAYRGLVQRALRLLQVCAKPCFISHRYIMQRMPPMPGNR